MDDIDEEILKQLPDDIRKEIEAERKKRNIKPREKSPPTLPQTSANENIDQQNMSFSQFDESILAQLPENIVEELKKEYSKK